MPDRLFDLVEREVRRLGGGQAELYTRRARVRRYDAREGRIDSISISDTVSLSVRVFRSGRNGFSYGFGDDEETVRRVVEAAVFCADACDPDEGWRLPRGEGAAPRPELCDPGAGTVDDRELAEFACGLEMNTLARDPRLKRVRYASLRETVAEESFRNSAGGEGDRRESSYYAAVDAVAEDGGEGQTGSGFGFSRGFRELSLEEVSGEAARNALRMLGSRPLRTGRYAAVLENGVAADLLDVLASSFLASSIVKGKSMLAGKNGRKIASPGVTVEDDPFDPGGSGAAEFDAEGSACRRNLLVSEGELRGFLADTFWGEKIGTGSTGSCRRATAKAPPAAGVSNLRLSPGGVSPEGILRELGEGVVLTEFLGIHTADPVSGDFSVGAAGIRFERGEMREPVRGFAVSGNVLSLLSDVAIVGSDFRWFGSTGAPSFAVSGIEIGGE